MGNPKSDSPVRRVPLAFFKGTYSASDQAGDGGGSFEEGEYIEVMEVLLPEAIRMVEDGAIRDAKTIILLQRLMIEKLSVKATTC